jgi:hypothetical protein
MSKQLLRFGLTPREHRISALPSTVGSIIVLAITVFNGRTLRGAAETSLFLALAHWELSTWHC